jgi:hypothetical protein
VTATKSRKTLINARRNRGSATVLRGPYTDAELLQLAFDLLDPTFRRTALRMINREAGRGGKA